ncbi:hypothetical protein [Allomuricauda sp. NBRC 101325]|nr:hypothetical protein [Muricauda sp. NBRC 101325]
MKRDTTTHRLPIFITSGFGVDMGNSHPKTSREKIKEYSEHSIFGLGLLR